jgi:hypothetical protein
MFFLSCGALFRLFSLLFSCKHFRKKKDQVESGRRKIYNKKRREKSGEFVKGEALFIRKFLRYYSTFHLQFYPYFTISPTHTITPTHIITPILTPTHTITPTLTPTHTILHLPFTITLFNNYHYLITTPYNTINSLKKLIE